MLIELNKEEMDYFVQLLERDVSSLLIEIRHAKHNDFKEFLKNREAMAENLLAMMKQKREAA